MADSLQSGPFPLGFVKNPQGKYIRSETKVMAYNVYKRHFITGGNSKSKCVKLAAKEIGIGESTVWKIIEEMERNGCVKPPNRKRNRKTLYGELNEDQKKTICQIALNYFKNDEPPTTDKVYQAIIENKTLPPLSRSSVWRILKKLGFVWEKRGPPVRDPQHTQRTRLKKGVVPSQNLPAEHQMVMSRRLLFRRQLLQNMSKNYSTAPVKIELALEDSKVEVQSVIPISNDKCVNILDITNLNTDKESQVTLSDLLPEKVIKTEISKKCIGDEHNYAGPAEKLHVRSDLENNIPFDESNYKKLFEELDAYKLRHIKQKPPIVTQKPDTNSSKRLVMKNILEPIPKDVLETVNADVKNSNVSSESSNSNEPAGLEIQIPEEITKKVPSQNVAYVMVDKNLWKFCKKQKKDDTVVEKDEKITKSSGEDSSNDSNKTSSDLGDKLKKNNTLTEAEKSVPENREEIDDEYILPDLRPEFIHNYSVPIAEKKSQSKTTNGCNSEPNRGRTSLIMDYVDGEIVWSYEDKLKKNITENASSILRKILTGEKTNENPVITPICCICVENNQNLTNINGVDNDDTYYNKLKFSFKDLEFKIEDSYSFICDKCSLCIRQVCEFRKLCNASYHKLQKYKDKAHLETETETAAPLETESNFKEQPGKKDASTETVKMKNKLFDEKQKETLVSLKALKEQQQIHVLECDKFIQAYGCDLCSEKFTNLTSVYHHKLKAHTKKRYKIMILKNQYNSLKKQRRMSKKLDGFLKAQEKNFQCDQCGKKYYTEHSLRKHKYLHDKYRSLCDICGKIFLRPAHLKSHLISHSENKPYHCQICGKYFKSNSLRQIHLKTHCDDRKYICEICGKMFKLKEHLVKHYKVHNAARPYQCTVCDKFFSVASVYKTHMRTHTGETPFQCVECGEEFITKSQLQRHNIVMHLKVKNFQCDVCSKQFYFMSNLRAHKVRHSDEYLFVCELCGKAFKRKVSFDIHFKQAHSNQQLFECRVCKKKFSRVSQLRKHRLLHDEAMYKCDQCDRKFRYRSYLLLHQEKSHCPSAYSCPDCNKGFEDQQAMSAHCCENVCPICHRECSKKIYLLQHMRIHAPVIEELLSVQ